MTRNRPDSLSMKSHLIAIAITIMLGALLISCGRSSRVVVVTDAGGTQSDNGAFVIAAGDRALGYLEFSMNAKGDALLAWRNYDGTVHAVYYRPDQLFWPWSGHVQVSTNSSIAHKAAVAENGDCFLVWEDGAKVVGQNRYDAQAGWGTATGIPQSGTGGVSSPTVAAGPQGTAFALWKEYTSMTQSLLASRYEAATGWTAAEPVQELTGSGFGSYTVAVDASGNALAVWEQYVNYSGIYTVLARRYQAGVGWGQVEILMAGDDPYPFNVAFDAAGNALVVWGDIYYNGDGYRRIVSRRYDVNSGWEPVETLIELPVDTSFIYEVHMAMNPDGDAVLVWMQDDVSGFKIWADRYRAGSGWTKAPVRISDVGDTQDPQVAIDPAGNAVVVWRTVFDSWDIWSARYSPATGWDAARMISSARDNINMYADRPFVGMDAQGNAFAVWEEHDSENDIVSFWGNRLTGN